MAIATITETAYSKEPLAITNNKQTTDSFPSSNTKESQYLFVEYLKYVNF